MGQVLDLLWVSFGRGQMFGKVFTALIFAPLFSGWWQKLVSCLVWCGMQCGHDLKPHFSTDMNRVVFM